MRTDSSNAQADLNLHLAHMSEGTWCDVAAQNINECKHDVFGTCVILPCWLSKQFIRIV